jgi:protein-S-isoprenylcysteine O-methyltransferase Ste14
MMKPLTRAIIRYNAHIGVYLAFFTASLFFPAGTFAWTMGWIYLALIALSMFANSLILLLRNPGLFQERVDRKGKRDLDRILAGVMSFFGPISICIVSGFNFRYQWPPQMPFIGQITGLVLVILGCMFAAWAVASNRYFYGFLRIAREAGHTVCTAGAYRLVRHPAYLGAIIIDLATPLVLNSAWAFIPAIITTLAIIMRTKLEDGELLRNLAGYQVYAQQVRRRLIPFIW